MYLQSCIIIINLAVVQDKSTKESETFKHTLILCCEFSFLLVHCLQYSNHSAYRNKIVYRESRPNNSYPSKYMQFASMHILLFDIDLPPIHC